MTPSIPRQLAKCPACGGTIGETTQLCLKCSNQARWALKPVSAEVKRGVICECGAVKGRGKSRCRECHRKVYGEIADAKAAERLARGRYKEQAEDLEFMLATGESPHIAARRLGSTPEGVAKMMHVAGRMDLYRAMQAIVDAERKAKRMAANDAKEKD